jgi:hypothetical protein
MWASSTYIVPRRAIPETRRWATPRLPETRPLSGTHPTLRWATPALRRTPVHPSSGLSTLCWAPVRVSVCPTRQWVSRATLVALSGHSVWHWIVFTCFTTYGRFRPFSKNFIHCPENASTFQKTNPLLRNFILCREISSSVQKVHLLRSKFILCLPNSSTMPFLKWGYM